MQCSATSKQSGARCKRHAIVGGSVCKMHGGGAPQTRARAQERIAQAFDPALAYLLRASRQKEINAAGVQAARDLLDRAGFAPTRDPAAPMVQINIDASARESLRARILGIKERLGDRSDLIDTER